MIDLNVEKVNTKENTYFPPYHTYYPNHMPDIVEEQEQLMIANHTVVTQLFDRHPNIVTDMKVKSIQMRKVR